MKGQLLNNIVTFPFVIIAVVVDLYLLINGTTLFGPQFRPYRTDLELYLVMLATIGLVQSQISIPELRFGIGTIMLGFVPSFLLTALLLGSLDTTNIVHASGFGPSYLLLQVVYYIFVVAFSEETIFRGYLLTYFSQKHIPFPWLAQGILFGLFHYYAYSGLLGFEWYAVIEAMVFGSALGLLVYYAQKFGRGSLGLGAAMGIHAAWDIELTTGLFAVGAIL